MTRRPTPRRSEAQDAFIRQRMGAAMMNNPNICARELAEQTGCSLGEAIAAVEKRR